MVPAYHIVRFLFSLFGPNRSRAAGYNYFIIYNLQFSNCQKILAKLKIGLLKIENYLPFIFSPMLEFYPNCVFGQNVF